MFSWFLVLSQLHQNGNLLSEMEFSALLQSVGNYEVGSSWLFRIITSQETKSTDVVDATVDTLERQHFKEYAKILQGIV